MIVNGGSAGYVFDGDPTASWALIDVVDGSVTAEIKRVEFDALAAADAVADPRPARRRLPGRDDPHGEAGPVTGGNGADRRVVVTGMGLVTALGVDVASTWDGLRRRPLGDPPDHGLRPRPRRLADRRARSPTSIRRRSSTARSSAATTATRSWPWSATREAMAQAGLPARLDGELAERTGILLGTGIGGGITFAEQVTVGVEKGPDRISPFFIPMAIPNLAAGQAAIVFGALGPNFAVSSACATGGHALGEAWEIIRRGDADMMIAGSSEAGINEALVGGFAAMRALSTRNDDPAARLAPVRPGPRRLRDRGGRRRRHPRGPRARPRPRRGAARRARRLRRVGGRQPHHAPGARRDRGDPGDPAGAGEGAAHASTTWST